MAMIQLSPKQLRDSTMLLAISTIGFSLLPVVMPRTFASVFGLPAPGGHDGVVPIQSVGARDVVSGIGMISATMHGGRVAPWLLGRLLSDVTDVLWIVLAFLRGTRSPRLAALGAMALGAAVADFVLYRNYKSASGSSGEINPL